MQSCNGFLVTCFHGMLDQSIDHTLTPLFRFVSIFDELSVTLVGGD